MMGGGYRRALGSGLAWPLDASLHCTFVITISQKDPGNTL